MQELGAGRRRALDALLGNYREQLPERLRLIETTLRRFEAAPDDRVAGDALYRLVHTLAGSAAIYGFEGISRRALALERAILARLSDPERVTTPLATLLAAVTSEIT